MSAIFDECQNNRTYFITGTIQGLFRSYFVQLAKSFKDNILPKYASFQKQQKWINQKYSNRGLPGLSPTDSETSLDMLQHLSWYSLKDRYKDALLVMRYKITNEKVATCFTEKKQIKATPQTIRTGVQPKTTKIWPEHLNIFKQYPRWLLKFLSRNIYRS